MGWLRLRAKRLSLLALFALAVQLGLSFGHTHFEAAFAKPGIVQASTAATPTGGDPDGGNDVCAICATIALANALIDSVPPLLPVPATIVAADSQPATFAFAATPQRAGFQSRAPPRS